MAITGIGGFFFRAADPKALGAWYKKHLGVMPDGYEPWMQTAGPTMIVPFARDADSFPLEKQWMINFRVSDLGQLISALRGAGIEVVTKVEWDTPETGTFARIFDPEGNAVELWEPPAE